MGDERTVAGRTVGLPVRVRDALAASASFLADVGVLDSWLPQGLRARRVLPGRGLLGLTAVDYRDNDLGPYDELGIAVAVRGGVFIHRLPVDDEFSRAAGVGIWGFPKTVEDLSVERVGDEVVCAWAGVLRFVVDARGRRSMRPTTQHAYSTIDGALHHTPFTMSAEGFAVRPGGARIELGSGPVADELRAAGLPRRPLFSLAMGRMQANFGAPAPV